MHDRKETIELHADSLDWPSQLHGFAYPKLDVIGDASLLSRKSTVVFCSSKCPGDIILKATKWIAGLAEDPSRTMVGGFHSAMEKSFLEILLIGKCGVVVCPARSLVRYRLPAAYRQAVSERRLVVVSSLAESVRSNSATSSLARNRLVANLADEIVVAHAAEGSRTEQFAIEQIENRKTVLCLDPACNTLLAAGAKLFTSK